jgi:class 3 adenylate cyclase
MTIMEQDAPELPATSAASANETQLPGANEDDDEKATHLSHVMSAPRRASEVGEALAERANLISSVNWLGSHVPVCVLNRLGQEIRLRYKQEDEGDSDSSGSWSGEDSTTNCSQHTKAALLEEIRALAAQGEDNSLHEGNLGESLASLHEEDIAMKPPKRVQRRNSSEWRLNNVSKSSLFAASRRNSYKSIGDISEISLDFKSDDGIISSEDGGSNDTGASQADDGQEVSPQDVSNYRRPASPSQQVYSSHPGLVLPFASTHECALLFVDISGFTKLSTLLDPESLSKVINAYFQMIINQVTSHGGDVLKFAGDGLFAEWQATSEESPSIDGPHLTQPQKIEATLAECVAAAATCGAKIVNKCSDYPVFMNGESGRNVRGAGEQVASLNVHCGLGAGEVIGVHVGDNKNRREYLILGDPIDQVAEAADAASLGELLASPEALEIMIQRCKILNESGNIKSSPTPTLIARKNLSGFTPKLEKQQRRCYVTHMWEGWDTNLLKEYRQLICLYAHPVVVDNELNTSGRVASTAQQRHSEEAEIRTVYVMFISMPRVRVNITGNGEKDEELFKMLNSIMNTTTRELERFHGHLRQFIVDDKGLVLIATFGLRGSTSPNMVTERGLPATTAIHNALQNELGVFNRVGGTVGNAYCGVVGGVERHEYAVMGPSVNLAARLMCSAQNPGILVDDAVRIKAGKAYSFKSLAPVTAKGYCEPVPIFEPLSSLERRWGRIGHFVGRKEETTQILDIARVMTSQPSPSKMIFVAAESGTGKSTLVIHAVEQLRRIMSRGRRKFIIAKHVCRESDLLVPFSMFRSVLIDILAEVELQGDDKSSRSGGSRSGGTSTLGSSCSILDWDVKSHQSALSRASRASTTSSSRDHVSRILAVCDELNAPPEFVELIGHHLLGADLGTYQGLQAKSKKVPNLQVTINFMDRIFQKCTKNSRLTVLALDDVHQMDEMSWRVVQKLFGSARNLLIICTSRPLSKNTLTIDKTFWEQLTGASASQGRFFTINLNRLEVDDIKQMIAKNLGIENDDICEDFQKDVFTQSRGMPHFASEILSSARRRNSIGMVGDMFGWTAKEKGKGTLSHSSVGDIIVARLDSFDAYVRNALNLGAVIGLTFELADVIAIAQHFAGESRKEKEEQSKKIHDALDVLVSEGILIETVIGGDAEAASSLDLLSFVVVGSTDDNGFVSGSNANINPYEFTNKSYQFCHDVWRSSILKLMLDSRKKHIHRTIAQIIEQHQANEDSNNFSSRMKLFSHWRSAGEATKAATVALAVGKSFEDLGLHEQGIKLYEDTVSIWRDIEPGSDEGISGISYHAMESINVTDLEFVIKAHIALGKCLANVHRGGDSVVAYQDALRILQACPCADQITDRSLVFPIFSGLFLALKFGQIEQDEACTYEQNLVERFVGETKLNGDPIHYTRALAMQAEMYGGLRNYERAFEVFEELKANYDIEQHSEKISESYGSDRSAQCFAVSCLWFVLLDRKDEALVMCDYIFEELMPKMDVRNVHNACVMLYPTIWVMKGANRSLEMLEIFIKYVVTPFDEYYGEGAFTFFLPAYDPIMMLLELDGRKGQDVEHIDDISDWAIHEDNLRFGTVINNTLGGYGRACNSISAEICLLLAQRPDVDDGTKRVVVENGLDVGKESLEFCEHKRMWHSMAMDTKILQELECLARAMNIKF